MSKPKVFYKRKTVRFSKKQLQLINEAMEAKGEKDFSAFVRNAIEFYSNAKVKMVSVAIDINTNQVINYPNSV